MHTKPTNLDSNLVALKQIIFWSSCHSISSLSFLKIASSVKMSGTSNVGNSQVYEAGDQKTVPQSEIDQEKKDNRFHEGKENSHKANDSSKRSLRAHPARAKY
jgi:hypothetical protein